MPNIPITVAGAVRDLSTVLTVGVRASRLTFMRKHKRTLHVAQFSAVSSCFDLWLHICAATSR